MSRWITFTAVLVSICLIGYLLIVGRGFLLPWLIALFIWNLLNTLNDSIQGLPIIGRYLPSLMCMAISLMVVLVSMIMIGQIVGDNVNEVLTASVRYQAHFQQFMKQFNQVMLSKLMSGVDQWVDSFNFQKMFLAIYSGLTTLTGSTVLVVLYVGFLFVEQLVFERKLALLMPSVQKRKIVKNLITRILQDIQTYLGIKTLMGLLTALASFGIMTWVGLDFAAFWALLIFFLNYIPNIGAILATIFPALLALIQFQTWLPGIMMTSGLVVIQFIIGNILEPRFLGRSLNLSPLVILLALGLWGTIWGILGMFLAVPITVVMLILFAHFPTTRPIAILLSRDGQVNFIFPKQEVV